MKDTIYTYWKVLKLVYRGIDRRLEDIVREEFVDV